MARLTIGADHMERTMTTAHSRSRRRCSCCKRRATHVGRGGGVVLMTGCEWSVRQWVKSPRKHHEMTMRRIREAAAAEGRPAVEVGQIWRDRTFDDRAKRYLRVVDVWDADHYSPHGEATLEHVRPTLYGWRPMDRKTTIKLGADGAPKSYKFVLHAEAKR